MTEELFEQIKSNFLDKEKFLCSYATHSEDGERFLKEEEDFRPSFYRDVDRIIHALSYTRYIDKTQVYSFKQNDHISKRSVHVQLVSKIARTIGRALRLNEDLIEAISLGHDIGHTPIGHTGESILNDISCRELGEFFSHNVQSVRTYLVLENDGSGNNLTVQVLDGILCHNGEMLSKHYEPILKTKEEFLKEYELCYTNESILRGVRPMTLEGCVVRISDMIAYIGRDIEDAIRLNTLNRDDIPEHLTKLLGNNNRDIINTIILDIITNSYNKPYIEMSDEIYNALKEIKKFNTDNIYSKANRNDQIEYYKYGMNLLFGQYLKDIENNNFQSNIFKTFLSSKSDTYKNDTCNQRKVIDFIAGMTDEFFYECVNKTSK